MPTKERTYLISFKSIKDLEMKLMCETENPNTLYFTKYKELFDPDEWDTINLIEGEIIPLVNQLDEIHRATNIQDYEEFRENLNVIWETYKLEREAIRLKIDQEIDFENGSKLKRIV